MKQAAFTRATSIQRQAANERPAGIDTAGRYYLRSFGLISLSSYGGAKMRLVRRIL
jgi:hypothetical protein